MITNQDYRNLLLKNQKLECELQAEKVAAQKDINAIKEITEKYYKTISNYSFTLEEFISFVRENISKDICEDCVFQALERYKYNTR